MFNACKHYRVYRSGNNCYLLSTMNPRYASIEAKRRKRVMKPITVTQRHDPAIPYIGRQLLFAFGLTLFLLWKTM